MARISQDDFSGQSDTSDTKTLNIEANGQESIEVPSNDFISDANMSREGQDLVLEAPNGNTLVIENYFISDSAPLIESPDGSILTPNLVHSFLTSPAEFAQASSMVDESPVGAVEEMSGEANIIHTDGTSETATLGTPIYQGDIIETSNGGAVNIVFIDETSMAVSENARLSVDNYQFDPSTESGETNISVLRGVFVFTSGLIGRDDPDDVMIDTPVGSIGIRGTIIAGHINPAGQSEITVVEGAIVVKNGAMETTLSQQYESVRLDGFNDNMHDIGVKNAQDMGKTYGSVSDVVPKLFSSINDTVKEQKSDPASEAKEESPADETLDENAESQDTQGEEDTPQDTPQDDLVDSNLEVILERGQAAEHRGATKHDRLRGNSHFRDGQGREHIDHINNPTFLNNHDSDEPTLPVSAAGHAVTVGTALNDLKVGDFNGDGNSDFANIHNGNGNIVIGDSSGVIYTSSGNYTSLSSVGDINNDGYADIIGGNPSIGNGHATLIKGSFSTPTETSTTGSNTGDQYGYSVAGIGDVDGDGKSDYAISSPGANTGDGKVYINLAGGDITIAGNGGEQLGEHVAGAGDVNGDGLSDVLISGGANEGYVIFGNSATPSTGALTGNDFKITADNGDVIVGGGAAGDINGDGFDDFAVSIDNGTDVNTYVVYGKSTTFGSLTMAELENPDNALKIHHAGVGSGGANDYQVTEVGDIDGDGFDDVQVGVAGGSQFVVHGALADMGGAVPYAMDGTATDGSGSTGTPDGVLSPANSSVKALVGDVHFFDNGETNLSMKGGGSNNHFSITNNSFQNIDGGTGNLDTIRFGVGLGTLDFTSINFEQVSQIERIHFSQNNATIRLTAENIFNLLKSSDDGSLKIELGSTGGTAATNGTLEIATGTSNASATTSDVVNALNNEGSGATYDSAGSTGSGYAHYEIGGYNLYIADNVAVETV